MVEKIHATNAAACGSLTDGEELTSCRFFSMSRPTERSSRPVCSARFPLYMYGLERICTRIHQARKNIEFVFNISRVYACNMLSSWRKENPIRKSTDFTF